jgi:hypothetical protein
MLYLCGMIKEIQYQGYATEPSDYECADGQLTTSLNVISEDGQLKPVFQPFDLAELPDGYKVVYLHDANTFAHYILQYTDSTGNRTLHWIDERFITKAVTKPVTSAVIAAELANTPPSHALGHTFSSSLEIYKVDGIGNTVVVLTSEGMHYFLWKGDTEGYLYLGSHLPELHLSFGLQGTVVRSDEFDVENFESIHSNNQDERWGLDDENQTKVTNQVLAKVNKFIAEEATEKGRFIYPFFVRYAYRLYDSSLVMHSAPVLMVAATGITPIVDVRSRILDSSTIYWKKLEDCRVVGITHKLDYAVLDQAQITALEDWSDIVRSVDIFISKPIYTYDQNGKIKDINDHGYINMTLCKHVNQDESYSQHECKYQYSDFQELANYTFVRRYDTALRLPEKSLEAVKEEIRTTSQFYFLKSINVADLTTTRTAIDVAKETLQSLPTREAMTDDYDSHDKLIPRYSFAYNARLNVANLKKSLYNTFNIASLLSYSDGFIKDDGSYESIPCLQYQVSFVIKQDGKEIVVQGGSYELSHYMPVLYLYYPNVNVKKAIIRRDYEYFELPMEAHPMLNGAVNCGGWGYGGVIYHSYAEWYRIINNPPTPSTAAERIIEVPNKIYTSQVNNPFLFPVLGINTVGTGRILGISAAVKAMSQGQFGQFPLYAFTTEGVWALEVSNTGSYSARQPATRDVCISTESITQIDDAVLFATDRGIMLIQGSETKCLTDTISSEAPFDVLENLPGIDQLHAKLGHDADTCLPVKPFLGFLDGCRMVYDYVHQHIIVFNPTMETVSGVASPKYTYAYVYSLKSRLWGMMFSDLSSPVNSYPEALAMTQDNRLKSFSMRDEDAVCKALYVTRPVKLDAVDVYKTVSGLIQRGHFERGDVGTALYGSRDLYNWFLVWSSRDHTLRNFRGTPYKYFRIAGLATLTEGKTIFGASVDMEMKHTNKLR